ncbi:MAG TPA: trehalose-phosphatase [Candidatus Polarisedimenticolia bacterium]|nr:trehalose-phosphatase [Candidatus Polarisedimenticolia bacterium]
MKSRSEVPAILWEKAAAAPARLLMLDYDGTLAPFQVDRSLAVPHRRVPGLVRRAASVPEDRIAIVSGRPVAELAALVGALPVELIGEHGWERRLADGRLVRHPPAEADVAALERAAQIARDLGHASRVERKRASLVLHTRGLSDEEASRVERDCSHAWRDEPAPGRLRPRRVNGGLELRAPGRDKGMAVRELLEEASPGTLAVYIGDDETDEDAFAAVSGAGYGLLVAPGPRPSLAAGRLASVQDVVGFLTEWVGLVTSIHGAAGRPSRAGRAR